MQSKINYTYIGLFVLILSLCLIIIPLWLFTGLSGKQYQTYVVYMNESVSGLSENAAVKYNGVDVGQVSHISLNPNNPRQVKLLLNIDETVPVHQDTVAILNTQGLTGIAYIGLKGGSPSSPLVKIQKGETYPIIRSAPSLLFRLDETLQHLTLSIQKVSKDMQNLLSEKNLQSFENILQHLEKTSAAFAANSTEIDNSLQRLPTLIKHFDQTTLQTTQAIHAFSTQVLPNTINELQHLNTLTTKLNQAADKIQENPAVLLRGAQPAPLGPGEN